MPWILFKFMDDCHKLIYESMSTWYILMAVKCKFIQGSLLQKLASSFLTNCFQENWVAASKVSGAPIFRARILASRPNQVICPISDKVVLLRDKDSCRKTWRPCGKNWQILGGKFGRLAPQNSGQVFQTFGPAARLHQSIAVRTNQPKWCNAFLLKIGKNGWIAFNYNAKIWIFIR